jgi:hypothetical protein
LKILQGGNLGNLHFTYYKYLYVSAISAKWPASQAITTRAQGCQGTLNQAVEIIKHALVPPDEAPELDPTSMTTRDGHMEIATLGLETARRCLSCPTNTGQLQGNAWFILNFAMRNFQDFALEKHGETGETHRQINLTKVFSIPTEEKSMAISVKY